MVMVLEEVNIDIVLYKFIVYYSMLPNFEQV